MSMNMAVVIGLGVIAWVVVATLVALVVARMVKLRDHQRPRCTAPGGRGRSGGTEWFVRSSGSGMPEKR